MRRALLLSGLLVLAFGLGCLNYTTGGKSEFHRAWAREHGLPEPGNVVYVLGVACTAGGGGLVGFVIGRRRRE